ncbi:hypothetical protein PanWU01x14_147070 [Parasponia andersonii]|uniref:Transmembrane protein n=1 Tax=Parasponia andersonii TaxID=3476 RepID=A0A2P5CJU6_PARAD|nr:hypothetical protein PanWU01x14_147070 [Parasponia andersonii]
MRPNFVFLQHSFLVCLQFLGYAIFSTAIAPSGDRAVRQQQALPSTYCFCCCRLNSDSLVTSRTRFLIIVVFTFDVVCGVISRYLLSFFQLDDLFRFVVVSPCPLLCLIFSALASHPPPGLR